jgi:hypothetical protein
MDYVVLVQLLECFGDLPHIPLNSHFIKSFFLSEIRSHITTTTVFKNEVVIIFSPNKIIDPDYVLVLEHLTYLKFLL